MTNARIGRLEKHRWAIIVTSGCLLAALALVFMAQPAWAICPSPPCVPDPNTNTPPSVLLDNNNPVTVNEGQTATKSGTYNDPDQNNVGISASPVGNIVNKTGAYTGNWTWSFSTSDNQSRTITITASDGLATGTAQFNLTVNNVAPTATGINAPASLNEGSGFLVSLANPTDPSSADMGSLQYRFDCGDGLGYGAFGSTNSRSCSTTDSGNRTVKGQLRDKDGGTSVEYSRIVTVNNVAPTANLDGPDSVDEGAQATISFIGQDDPSSADRSAGFRYAFDCNGGPLGAATYANSGTSTSVECVFDDGPATKSVSARIFDKDGGSTLRTHPITVNNLAPTATGINAPTSVNQGSNFTLSLRGVSDASSADMSSLQYRFDCGDGLGYGAFGSTNSRSCSTTDSGNRTVKGQLRDKDDGTSVEYISSVKVLPLLRINDVSKKESINAVFTVRLSAASQQTVKVNYATANGTAKAPADYTAKSGTLTFQPGQLTKKITVAIKDDRRKEPNETYFVKLSGPSNAAIADASGKGTILNND